MKKLIVLGASGSIGRQTLDVCELHSDKLELVGVAVGKKKEYLEEILERFKVKYAYSIERCQDLEKKYPDTEFLYGDEGLIELVRKEDYDTLVNALVGFTGLRPTIEALKCHKDIALANKESLVAAGDIVNKLLKETGCHLYPIDSEHSAIWQCLAGSNREDIKRLIITGSGGAFRKLKRDELAGVTAEDALKHPTWQMGAKITVDCATMMNKGFEVMEAHYLFNLDYDQIDVILHDESIIHSFVEYKDGAVLAQMAMPDMRIPIQYALLSPSHEESPYDQEFDLGKIGSLNFHSMNYERYPLVDMVKKVASKGGNIGAIINGANDTAVEMFINHEIGFIDIERAIFAALDNIPYIKDVTLDDIYKTHDKAQEFVKDMFKK